MKTFTGLVAVLALTVGIALGAGVGLGSYIFKTAREAQTPKTLIGVFSCNKLLGIAIVTSDGEVHPYRGELNAETVGKLQHLVPPDHRIGIQITCGAST